IEADPVQVVDGGAEPDGLRNRRRAGLELVRQLVPRRALDGDGADHSAPELEGLHPLEQLAPPPEDADPGRPAQLVPGETEEVAVERLDVDRAVRDRLGRVADDDRLL